jgi:hypothetical protein
MMASFRRWLGRVIWNFIREGAKLDDAAEQLARAKALQVHIEQIARAEVRRVLAKKTDIVAPRSLS